MIRTDPALLLAMTFLTAVSCGTSREDGRRERLESFRRVLPQDILTAFDGIESRTDCDSVGLLLRQFRYDDPELDAAIDSIARAELIDPFSEEDIVYYFWYYFHQAIETGTVRGP